MAGTIQCNQTKGTRTLNVSMESGLDGRNNNGPEVHVGAVPAVSMESGLDGRNNGEELLTYTTKQFVSMESGLDGRNNYA